MPRLALVVATCMLVLGSLALPLGLQFYLAGEADQTAKARERSVVQNGLDARLVEIARQAVPQVVWDDAVANLDVDFNATWADENIGQFLSDMANYQSAVVLDRDGRVLYAMRDGETASSDQVADFVSAAAPLVAAVRRDEARRNLPEAIARGETLSQPILHTSTARIGDQAYMISAALVQPDFGAAMPRTERSAVVVSTKALDASFMASVQERFMLENLHLHMGVMPADPKIAQATVTDPHGQVVATLEWTPPTPGSNLLRHGMPLTLLALMVLGSLAAMLYLRTRAASERLIASEQRASHMARHDALTGLPNRLMLQDRLSMATELVRRTGEGFAIHCIDLDRFKEVNDTYGHAVGDELVRVVGTKLAGMCRKTDTVARLGGDEFAIVQTGATPASAMAFAERLNAILATPIDLEAARLHIGASIGVTLVQDGNTMPDEAMRQADLALYRAKDAGRNQFAFFEEDMDLSLRNRRALQEDLRAAIENGELTLAYQPQVNAKGTVVGVEGLLRWAHPTRGQVSPGTFVPLAEECGLISDLGRFALRQAIVDSARWPDLKIAINVSSIQLRQKNFAKDAAMLLEEGGVSAERFELEITEGLLLGDDIQTHETLAALRAMGFSIALDDFGTGYSSLSYLQRYPIDKIKIDRSFVANLGADAEAEAVVAAIVRLARALGLSVIAEGVETEMQRESLMATGCRDMQGFLFGRAVPPEKIRDGDSSIPRAA